MNSCWRCVFLSLKAGLMSYCDCPVDELTVTDLTVRAPAGRHFHPSLLLRSICFLLHCWFRSLQMYHLASKKLKCALAVNLSARFVSFFLGNHTHWSVLEHNLLWVVMYEISRGSLRRLTVFMTLCVGTQIPFQILFHFCPLLDKQCTWVTWVLIWSDH